MKKEVFKKVLQLIKENDRYGSQLCEALDNIIDGRFVSKLGEPLAEANRILLKEIYGEVGEDWISWFLWEKAGREDFNATDKSGKEICRNEDELWEMLEKEYKQS